MKPWQNPFGYYIGPTAVRSAIWAYRSSIEEFKMSYGFPTVGFASIGNYKPSYFVHSIMSQMH